MPVHDLAREQDQTRAGVEALPVSVIVPAYERADVLPRAIASIRAQRPHVPAEVIVVDDGSQDDTAAVADALGVRVVRHATNSGTPAARNSGVEAATQPWLALLDSDDEWLPHHLATLWALRAEHVLVAASVLRCGEDPRRDTFQGPAVRRPVVLDSPARLIFPGNIVPASAAMVKREAVEAAGGFRPPTGLEDLDLWLRVLDGGSGVVTPEVTAIYHEHGGQTSKGVMRMQEGHIGVAERFAGRDWWTPALVERWRATAAWNNLRTAVKHGRVRDVLAGVAWIGARPQRVAGVALTWSSRRRLRRHSARVRDELHVLRAGVGRR